MVMRMRQIQVRGAVFVAVDAAEHGDPGCLHGFFGDGAGGRVADREPRQRGVVGRDQAEERGFVAAAQCLDVHGGHRSWSRSATQDR